MVPTVTSVYVEGLLENPPKVSKQKIELQVEKVIDVGLVEPAKYPIAKIGLSFWGISFIFSLGKTP